MSHGQPSRRDPVREVLQEQGLGQVFAAGSKKVEDKEHPRFAEVTERFASVKKSMAALLDDLKPADLDKTCTALTDWFPTPLDSMLHFVRDANYHLGQLNYARRAGSAGGSKAD